MDFDGQMTGAAGVFMNAFGKEALAIYTSKRRKTSTPGIKVIYNPQVFAPDAISDGSISLEPFITVETAKLTEESKQGDKLEFDGIKVEVEHNDGGDQLGLTLLRVRII